MFLTWITWGRADWGCVASIRLVAFSKVKYRFGFGCVFTSWSRLRLVHPTERKLDWVIFTTFPSFLVSNSIAVNHEPSLQSPKVVAGYQCVISSSLASGHSKRNCQVRWPVYLCETPLLYLSLSLSESSSRTWTACLWYCSWDSTRDDSWLTCSIWKHTQIHVTLLPEFYYRLATLISKAYGISLDKEFHILVNKLPEEQCEHSVNTHHTRV